MNLLRALPLSRVDGRQSPGYHVESGTSQEDESKDSLVLDQESPVELPTPLEIDANDYQREYESITYQEPKKKDHYCTDIFRSRRIGKAPHQYDFRIRPKWLFHTCCIAQRYTSLGLLAK